MSTTVLEALENAQMNFKTVGKMGAKENPIFIMAMEQLDNGIQALENGKDKDEIIQENMFGDINVEKK